MPRWADHFVAITDEDTSLAHRARAEQFRDLFINPSDIGGRYSALSFFGLVPAALMGQDVAALLGWGAAMLAASEPGGDIALNPAVALGLAMGAAARAGRDKLTVFLPPELGPSASGSSNSWQKARESTARRHSDCRRSSRVARRLRQRSTVRVPARKDRPRRRGRRPESSVPAGRHHRASRAVGDRGRVRSLGGGDGDRRSAPGRQPVRRTERAAGEGRDAGPARSGTRRRDSCR